MPLEQSITLYYTVTHYYFKAVNKNYTHNNTAKTKWFKKLITNLLVSTVAST